LSARGGSSDGNIHHIKDAAALAGASPATASRVLSGNPATSAESRQRVAAAVTQLDFHPNAQARALRSTGTNVIVTAAPLNSAPMYCGLGHRPAPPKEQVQ
jgi:LacI family transcriptional regulator